MMTVDLKVGGEIRFPSWFSTRFLKKKVSDRNDRPNHVPKQPHTREKYSMKEVTATEDVTIAGIRGDSRTTRGETNFLRRDTLLTWETVKLTSQGWKKQRFLHDSNASISS